MSAVVYNTRFDTDLPENRFTGYKGDPMYSASGGRRKFLYDSALNFCSADGDPQAPADVSQSTAAPVPVTIQPAGKVPKWFLISLYVAAGFLVYKYIFKPKK